MTKRNNRKKSVNAKSKSRNEVMKNNNFTDFDYEKLAMAIVRAHEIYKKSEEDELTNETKQNIREWHKIIGYKDHSENENWIKGKLLSVRNFISIFIHFLLFNKKHVRSDVMTYALLQMATSIIFSACKWILYYVSLMCAIKYVRLHYEPSDTIKEIYIIYACVAFVFARIFRIAVFEIDNMKDKNYLIAIFSATTCFIAMIIAIITYLA